MNGFLHPTGPGGPVQGYPGASVIAPEWFQSWPGLPIRLSAAVTSRLAGGNAIVLTVASVDQRATTPGASHAPGVVGRTGLPDSAAGLRDDGQPSGAGLRSTWPSTHEEASAPPPPLPHPERASRRGTGQLPSIETGPQPRRRLLLAPGIVAGTGRWATRSQGQSPTGWLAGGRRQRPPSYRGTPTTLPPLPANRRTPPAVVATEGVRAGQAHSKERSEPARRYVSHGGRARFHRRLT
jgi:hypothetical protein